MADLAEQGASAPPTHSRTLIGWGLLALAVVFALWMGPVERGDAPHLGWISLLPTLAVLILALSLHRTLEALVGGCLFGYLMLDGPGFLIAFADSGLKVMGNPTIGWIILVCGFLGSLIALLGLSGATQAFSEWLGSRVKGRRGTLLSAWALGLVIFIDDYLNALAVSASMRKLCDRFKISRPMLAYVVDSTAAPMCVLVPMSTWAIYSAGLLEGNGVAAQGEGLSLYLQAVPYMFYAWIALLLVPLVGSGLIPPLGPMRKAEQRTLDGTAVIEDSDLDQPSTQARPRLINFLLPLAALIGFTLYFDVDAFKGTVCALLLTILLYAAQRLATLHEIFESVQKGFQSMLMPLGIVVTSFVLQDINDKLGLTPYVIDSLKPLMTGNWLPAVTFITLSLITFSTGSFWGTFAVAFPIVLPLATALDASLPLTIGAVVSAGAFGSHACFYGDATVLSAKGSGCTPLEHALTQLPYVLIAAALSTLLFVVLA